MSTDKRWNDIKQSADIEAARRARHDVIVENMALVFLCLRRYVSPELAESIGKSELASEATIGLIEAVDKYDPQKGAFSTYAVYRIRSRLTRYLDTRALPLRETVWSREQQRKIYKVESEMEKEGHKASAEELSQRTGIQIARVKELMATRARQSTVSISLANAEGREVEDRLFVEQENGFEDIEADEEARGIALAMESLTPNQKQVVRLLFGFDGEPMNASSASRTMGLTHQRIHQLEEAALKRLKRELETRQVI